MQSHRRRQPPDRRIPTSVAATARREAGRDRRRARSSAAAPPRPSAISFARAASWRCRSRARTAAWGASWADDPGAWCGSSPASDGSLAHLFGFHHLLVATVRLFGDETQWRSAYAGRSRQSWFWGNALNPLDTRTTHRPGAARRARRRRDEELLLGRHATRIGWSSRRSIADRACVVAAIPTDGRASRSTNDWDNMGQRQTDSGTVDLPGRARSTKPRSCGRPARSAACSRRCGRASPSWCWPTSISGLGEGALEEAPRFTQSGVAPLGDARVSRARRRRSVHPAPLRRALARAWPGARALADAAGAALDDAWSRGDGLTRGARGACALAIAAAKVASARAGLDVANRMFEVTGARATAARHGLDRSGETCARTRCTIRSTTSCASWAQWALAERAARPRASTPEGRTPHEPVPRSRMPSPPLPAARWWSSSTTQDRENEGDLIMAAEKATPEALAFMVRHTSGVVCAALTGERLARAQLPLMVADNDEAQGTAFTVTVDYRQGTTTGISAADRAATLRALADPRSVRARLRPPGAHLPAAGAQRRRAASAADTPRRPSTWRAPPGLAPCGVLCELVNDDGSMARPADAGGVRRAAPPRAHQHRRPGRLPPAHRAAGEAVAEAQAADAARAVLGARSTAIRPRRSMSRW